MQIGKIVTIKDNEKYLRQISSPVSLKDQHLKKYIEILEGYCQKK